MDIQKKISNLNGLRWACRAAIVAASGVSVWGNFLHAERTPQAIAINVMSPILLLFALELGSRIPLREDSHWTFRLLRPLGMIVISGINAWLSYWHQQEAFFTYAKDIQTSYLLPIGIDGFMLYASISLLDLNVKVRQLLAHLDGDKVTTYKPRDPGVPIRVKAEIVSKKQQIAEIYDRYPEWKPAQIAAKVDATPSYVYGVLKELKSLRDSEPVTA